MRCPECKSSNTELKDGFTGRDGLGAAKAFYSGNIPFGFLQLAGAIFSKLVMGKWVCRDCLHEYHGFQARSMKAVLPYAAGAGVIGLLTGPIPGTSFFLFCLEVLMVVNIGKHYGQQIRVREVGLVMVFIFLVAQLLKMLAIELLIFVPFLGYAAQAIIAFFFAFFLGLAVDAYYRVREERMLASPGEVVAA